VSKGLPDFFEKGGDRYKVIGEILKDRITCENIRTGEYSRFSREEIQVTHEERKKRRQQVAEHIKNGASIEEVCRLFEMTYGMVRKSCKEFGVTVPRQTLAMQPNTIKILTDLKRGGSVSEIAEKYQITKQRVSELAKMAAELVNESPKIAAKLYGCGDLLREARERANFSRKFLSEELGVFGLDRMERNEIGVWLGTIEEISHLLGDKELKKKCLDRCIK